MAKHYNRGFRRHTIFNKYHGHCSYCGCELSEDHFAVDHIDPIFRKHSDVEINGWGREKGKDEMDNYNPCCMSCNSSKSTYTLEKWRKEISLKFDRCARDCSSYNLLLRFNLIEEKRDNILFYFEKNEINKEYYGEG